MRCLPLAVGMALVWAGCQCRPSPPPRTDPDTDPPQTTAETGNTGDTGPTPPCDIPEIEPNNSVNEPTALVLERRACGIIDAPLDLDVWSFSHEGSWLEVELDAAENAFTDPTFVLTPVGDVWAASRADDPESVNATLRFLAPAGDYKLAVSDQDFNGGERYGYDLLVSEAKPPVEWNRTEVEGNDIFDQAETVVGGDRIYGTMDNDPPVPDLDFYVITVPAGKHTLKIDIDAYDGGSSANLTVYLYDQAFDKLPTGCKDPCPASDDTCTPCALKGGVVGLELDPFGEYDSPGSEIVYIQVLEATDQEGPANWYVLSIDLED